MKPKKAASASSNKRLLERPDACVSNKRLSGNADVFESNKRLSGRPHVPESATICRPLRDTHSSFPSPLSSSTSTADLSDNSFQHSVFSDIQSSIFIQNQNPNIMQNV